MSKKTSFSNLSAKERLILALDLPNEFLAKQMVEELGEEVLFYKIGLGMMMTGNYFSFLDFLRLKGKKIFADLKIYDIPQTVAAAVKNLSFFEIDFLTIHTASREIMEAAAKNKGKMKILGVTVLTSLDSADLISMGFSPEISISDLVVRKAEMALKSGLDGVVASALEAKILRQNFGENFLIITPGIRQEAVCDDQKRVSDVNSALKNGASHLVVGRPITSASSPKQSAKLFLNKINETFRTS